MPALLQNDRRLYDLNRAAFAQTAQVLVRHVDNAVFLDEMTVTRPAVAVEGFDNPGDLISRTCNLQVVGLFAQAFALLFILEKQKI